MVRQAFLSKFALTASFFALGVIALGAFTRLIDAGLGCPDWPGCYGHLTVMGAENAGTELVAYKAWAEMIHRYFVAGLSIFIISISVIVFSQRSVRTHFNVFLAAILLALLVYQILLGQWTVTLKLLPVIVSQHLLGGFLIVSFLWLVYLNNKTQRLPFVPGLKKLLPWAALALLLVLFQISLGAWTSTNYASLSCTHFPFCSKEQVLTFHWQEAFDLTSPVGRNYEGGVLSEAVRQTIQMAHRFGALVLTVYLLIFMMIAVRSIKKTPELMAPLVVMFGLLCVQICLGVSNVMFKLPLVVALGHNLVAVLLLLAIITFLFKLNIVSRRVSSV